MTTAASGLLGARVEVGGTRVGAYVTKPTRAFVRLYGPDGRAVATHALEERGHGYREVFLGDVGEGTRYKLVVGEREVPDPFARWLPEGVHGPAVVVGPSRYRWRNGPGIHRPLRSQVIYELHVGAFTPEGTYRAATSKLDALARLGVTTVELMPLSSFAGQRGWGYDGVAHFAPFAPYGTPDELRGFIDAAHGLGLGVLLDVVYNHFGPSGNYLTAFSEDWLRHDRKTPWGDALDYRSPIMRRYLLENALYWLEDLRFDGLRLDAISTIIDESPRHVLAELADAVSRIEPRKTLIAEDDRNTPETITNLGMDGVWADDFHHQLHVTLTKEEDGYYAGYCPRVAEVARVIERGWLFEGQLYFPWNAGRGKPADELSAEHFVYCIQNHDQVGNRAFGERLGALVPPEAYRSLSALLLLLPTTPLLFMGQEWAASAPFLYFTDHEPDLGRAVTRGRREEFAAFAAFSDPERRRLIPDPQEPATFERSKLDWGERERGEHRRVLEMYGELLALRRTDPVLKRVRREGMRAWSEGDLLIVRLSDGGEERVVLVSFSDRPLSLPAALGEVDVLFATAASAPGSIAARAAVLLAPVRR